MTYMWMVYSGCAIFLTTLFLTLFLINRFKGRAFKNFIAWVVSGFSGSLILLFLSKMGFFTILFAVLTAVFWFCFIFFQRKNMREQEEILRLREESDAKLEAERAMEEAERAKRQAERDALLEKQIAEFKQKHKTNN